MPDLKLIIGNRNYSSWSLRPWLALRRTGAAFEETLIALDQPDSKASILAHSAAGQVPILFHGGLRVWESLAICEYLAEAFPEAKLWPDDLEARSAARSVSCEMHAGFTALRSHMPMDLRNRYPGQGQGPGVEADIARIVEIWSECRATYGDSGEFLFGDFTIADAMFAPVVGRFHTYAVDLPPVAAAYRDAVWNCPEMRDWVSAGEQEPWVIEYSKK